MSGKLWTDAELHIAVGTYLYVLQLQQRGVNCTETQVTSFLMRGPLVGRNDASIRYRFRNISAVLYDRGQPILSGYSPAPQVGSGVRVRIEAILDSHPIATSALETDGPQDNSPNPTTGSVDSLQKEAISRLQVLEKYLETLEIQFSGIGHNHPPEPIEDGPLTAESVSAAKEGVRILKDELSKSVPNADIIAEKKDVLLSFGLRLAGWIGIRLTKFADAALLTLAPIAVAKVTNILPLLSDAIASINKFLQWFPH